MPDYERGGTRKMKNFVLAGIIIVCAVAICITLIVTRSKPVARTAESGTSQVTSPSHKIDGNQFVGEWVRVDDSTQEIIITATNTPYNFVVNQINTGQYSYNNKRNAVYNEGKLIYGGDAELTINSDGNLVEYYGPTYVYRRR